MPNLYYPADGLIGGLEKARAGDPWYKRAFFGDDSCRLAKERSIFGAANRALDGERIEYRGTDDRNQYLTWARQVLSQMRDLAICAVVCAGDPERHDFHTQCEREVFKIARSFTVIFREWSIQASSGMMQDIELGQIACRTAAVLALLEEHDVDLSTMVTLLVQMADELKRRMVGQKARSREVYEQLMKTGWRLYSPVGCDLEASWINAGLIAASRALSARRVAGAGSYLEYAMGVSPPEPQEASPGVEGAKPLNPFPVPLQLTESTMTIVRGPWGGVFPPRLYFLDEWYAVDGFVPATMLCMSHLQAMDACLQGLVSFYGQSPNVAALIVRMAPLAYEYVSRVVGSDPPDGESWRYRQIPAQFRAIIGGWVGAAFELAGNEVSAKYREFSISGDTDPYPATAPFYDNALHGWAMGLCV